MSDVDAAGLEEARGHGLGRDHPASSSDGSSTREAPVVFAGSGVRHRADAATSPETGRRGRGERKVRRIAVYQRPGRWLLRVAVKSIDGEVSHSHRWTWLGRLLRFFSRGRWPVARVRVERAREIAIAPEIPRRRT